MAQRAQRNIRTTSLQLPEWTLVAPTMEPTADGAMTKLINRSGAMERPHEVG
jgi:hypothetical protein